MSKRLKFPEISLLKQPWDKEDYITETRHYKLITPLFGGGYKPGEPDEYTPIRATEIRGQLRFWWRALEGWKSNSKPEQLYDLEGSMWGTVHGDEVAGASRITIEVLNLPKATEEYLKPAYRDGWNKQNVYSPRPDQQVAPGYASFPLRPDSPEAKKVLLTSGNFSIKITYPIGLRKSVFAALWGWETFGGVGARTRRGFGAFTRENQVTFEEDALGKALNNLEATRISIKNSTELEAYLKQGLEVFSADQGWPSGVPFVPKKARFKIANKSWGQVVTALANFRQSRPKAQKQLPNGNSYTEFGRSHWPEPDGIRDLMQQYLVVKDKDDKTIIKKEHKPIHSQRGSFPRAAFGLPIIFWFKDGPKEGQPVDLKIRDPRTTTLMPKGSERLASPLLLRPYAGNLSIALIVEGSQGVLDNLRLMYEEPGKKQPQFKDLKSVAFLSSATGIKPLGTKTDVLQAFLDTL